MHMRIADAGQAGCESQHSTQANTANGQQADLSPAHTGQSGRNYAYTRTCLTMNFNSL